MANDVVKLIREHLTDWRTGWSMGSFGALGEFHWDDGEPNLVDDVPLARATTRGAIRFCTNNTVLLRPVAYETPSPKPRRWSQAVALCLPVGTLSAPQRSVLTCLGRDEHAVFDRDREAVLFDMGLSLPNCNFCIRTSDTELISVLRDHEGNSLFGAGHPAMDEILRRHPHRVAITPAGRVEVFQKIGGPDTGGVSPPGPHTHVLPKLLKSGRTHSANTPIPSGLTPVAFMHPGNPVIDEMGRDKPFDAKLYGAFREIMLRFGPSECLSVKEALEKALTEGTGPNNIMSVSDRFQRAALKVGLRQHERLAEHSGDGERASVVAQWLKKIENVKINGETDDDAPGH